METRIQFNEAGIPPTFGIQSPSSADKDLNPLPGIWNPWRGILGFPYMGRLPVNLGLYCGPVFDLRWLQNSGKDEIQTVSMR